MFFIFFGKFIVLCLVDKGFVEYFKLCFEICFNYENVFIFFREDGAERLGEGVGVRRRREYIKKMRYIICFRFYIDYLNILFLKILKLSEKWKGLL